MCVCVCIYMYIYICMYIYINMYIYNIYIHINPKVTFLARRPAAALAPEISALCSACVVM